MFSQTTCRAALCGLVLAGSGMAPTASAGDLQTFEVRERYGVSHPEQVIDFDLREKAVAGKVHVVGPTGEPVAFQLLDGGTKVAVLGDLPAGETRTWKLTSGAPPKVFPPLVQVTETTAGKLPALALTNNLTGVKVPGTFKPTSIDPRQWLTPNVGAKDASGWQFLPAPIQDVRMRDGKWAGPVRPGLGVEARRFLKSATRVLERGPLRAIVELSYELEHDTYYPGTKFALPAGKGYYRCTLRLDAGRPAVLIEEETDLNVRWYIDLYSAVQPDQFRYSGNYATKAEFGQDEDGKVYRGFFNSMNYDAILPLKYDRPRYPSYLTNEDHFATVSPWHPWAINGGRYWQMLNTKADAKGNVVGIFAAKAGRALGAGSNGPGFWLKPAAKVPGTKANPQAGIGSNSLRLMPDSKLFPKSRVAWGLFVGTKADVKRVKEVQPINREMNLLGGFNLNKVHRYATHFEDPPSGYGGLMMDRKAVEGIRQRVRDDKEGRLGKGFYGYLYAAEPGARTILDGWTEPGRAHFDKQVEASLKLAHELLDTLVNGHGILDFQWHYWMGGNQMIRQTVLLDQLLGDPRCTPEQTERLKAAAVLFGSVLWDDDYVPMQPGVGVSYGTANMPVQMAMARSFYALFLATHPDFRGRAKEALENAPKNLDWVLDANGIPMQSPNYTGAAVTPVINLLAMAKQRGRDPLKGNPRAGKFADFYLNLLTPPDPRFRGSRVADARIPVPLGDGGLDPSALYGLVGTALRDADPTASARLMAAWHQSKKPHSSFYGSSVVMIDETLPVADPKLGDYEAPNYYAVLRHGWGTPDESALWFVTGDRYSDHRHADQGAIVLYALGKPLVDDWPTQYNPQAGGSYMHNGCTLEKSLPFPWDQDGADALNAGTTWKKSTPLAFHSFEEGAMSKARFEADVSATGSDAKKIRTVTWTRTVVALRPDPARPVYVLRDEFDAGSSDLKKVLTLNVMANGPVETPAGPQTPPDRLHPGRASKDAAQLPSAGRPLTLPGGAGRFAFSGKYDIDCEVFVLADGAEALVGRWGAKVQSASVRDEAEREERQHILRVRTARPVTTVLVPHRRGGPPGSVTVASEGGAVIVRTAGNVYRVTADGYTVEMATGKKTSRSWSSR